MKREQDSSTTSLNWAFEQNVNKQLENLLTEEAKPRKCLSDCIRKRLPNLCFFFIRSCFDPLYDLSTWVLAVISGSPKTRV